MLIYLRKLTPNDTKKQIETTSEAYQSFFGGDINNSSGVNVTIKNSNGLNPVDFTVSKAGGNANSYRFRNESGGPSFGAYINQNVPGGFRANDILKIEKKRDEFKFFIINNSDQEYNVLLSMLEPRENTVVITEEVDISIPDVLKPFECNFSRNRIIFGAPGTGKSYTFNKESIGHKDYPDEDFLLKNGGEFERVTFHPDYSYAQFVGTYKPTMLDKDHLVLSDEQKLILDILSDKTLAGQKKYDKLWDICETRDPKFRALSAIPTLLRLFDPEAKFQAKKPDGSINVRSNDYYGNEIRPYVNLLSEPSSEAAEISYEYIPGPFMRTLVKALKNKKRNNIKPHLLLIEEINRANVSAVFGDVFQLLDRDDSNQSEYPIQASEDMKKFLVKELGGDISDYAQIQIPDNMFIWATMNSADQGVFPMDTAFKRRWDFTYQGINEGEKDIELFNLKMGGGQVPINWNELRKAINAELITYNVNEDKLMGAHFVKKDFLKDKETFDKTFKNKVIMYLFDDAAKQKRASLFSGVESPRSFKLYSDICETYDEIGIDIFSESIKVKFI